uniref:Uncharacterized protein n=1 Tax=Ciona savignyi TaxID=51511 RepID=H2ZF60_CIOSA
MTTLNEVDLPPPPPELLRDSPEHSSHGPSEPPEPRYVPNPVPGNFYNTMTLGRKPSNQSLQYSSSSGYSSQNTTPACSEDTIASHDTDYGSVDDYDETNGAPLRHNHDFERYSTLPRLRENGGHSQIRSAPSHNRRPASTSGYPAPSVISTPITTGTATIRRKPSSKFNSVRRTSNAPKPVTPPTVPGNAVSNLMSTFQQPDTNYRQNSYNHNNHNNNFEGTPVYSGEYDVNGDVNPMRDMTLKFQGVDVLETPTQTPTGLEYNPGDMNLYPGISPIPGVSPLLTRD